MQNLKIYNFLITLTLTTVIFSDSSLANDLEQQQAAELSHIKRRLQRQGYSTLLANALSGEGFPQLTTIQKDILQNFDLTLIEEIYHDALEDTFYEQPLNVISLKLWQVFEQNSKNSKAFESMVFVKDTIVMRWFKIFSWLSPFIFITAYGVARFLHEEDNIHCWMDDSLLLWIFSVPVVLSLVASFFFLINVLRVIVRKLHPQSAQPAPLAIRKAVRATIILVPLFGLQHFLLPYRPDSGTPLERFYQLLSVILVSLQGFVVSFLFCFANHDVTFAVRSLLNRLAPSIIAPPPPSSHTGQMATTTPSRELGV